MFQGHIAPASREWSSLIVAVKKPDGSIRLCVDYRKVNDITRQDMYPLPSLDDLISGIGQPKIGYLSSINMKSGYHQIPVAVDSQDKTTFVYSGGFYKYLFMPFGLKNAPAAFQCFMDETLHPTLGEEVRVYINDIITKTHTFKEHLKLIQKVVIELSKVGMMINLEKSKFLRSKVAYLGFELSANGLRPGEWKVQAVDEFPIPKDVCKVCKFN